MRFWPTNVCVVLAFALAFLGIRPTGDSAEYLLTARALASHGTPALRVEDGEWLARREPSLARVVRPLAKGIRAGKISPLPSVRRAPNGRYYSLHFWSYSLLGAPFLWLTELLRLRPVHALAAVNALAAAVALLRLGSHWGRGGVAHVAGVLFLLFATHFYLGWTGPEVLTASAVVSACLSSRRGDLAFALLAGSIAALQNPSAIALWPYAVFSWWPSRRALTGRELGIIAAAAALALWPYAFFFFEFNVWSLIATFATDPSLIGFERGWSLLFDLNQGMIMGIPGLVLASVTACALRLASTQGAERRSGGLDVLATLALVVCMAIPTFAIHNWNSGNNVMVRYAYWLAMPVFVLLLEQLNALGLRQRWALASGGAALQLAVLAVNGIWGERYSYVRHTWAAKVVLRHFPAAYNPVPEIFYERSLGREAPWNEKDIVVWPHRGKPRKIMVREGETPRSKRICSDGREITSRSVHVASGGWVYLDAPFGCKGGDGTSSTSGN